MNIHNQQVKQIKQNSVFSNIKIIAINTDRSNRMTTTGHYCSYHLHMNVTILTSRVNTSDIRFFRAILISRISSFKCFLDQCFSCSEYL